VVVVWVVGFDGITIKWIIIKWIIIKWITTPHVRAFLRDDASSEGKQQESASATYERAQKEGRRPTRTRAFLRDDGRG
jgi:Zn-dependent protease with chaperone function